MIEVSLEEEEALKVPPQRNGKPLVAAEQQNERLRKEDVISTAVATGTNKQGQ